MEKETRASPLPKHNVIQIGTVVLLIVAAFFIGSLYTKVKYLEKGSLTVAPSVAAPGTNQPAPAAIPVGDVPKVTKEDHVRGDRNARLALIEYSDLECPFCKSFHPTMQKVMSEFKGKVMWVYRHYPLDFHQNAQKEAEASECVYEQGGDDAFWKFVDAIYERTTSNGTGFALTALAPLAKELGLNDIKFQQCLDSGKYAQKVKDEQNAGTGAGVTGTPGTIILDTKSDKKSLIPGALPYEQVKQTIDGMLK